MKQFVGTLISLFLLILLGLLFLLAPKETPPYAPVDVGGGAIIVGDQPFIDIVILDAELITPGFITVHKAIGDAPGAVIGESKYLETGVYANMQIVLLEMMIPGETYITLLHTDDGDQVFDIQRDLPVMVDGQVVRPSFVVLGESN